MAETAERRSGRQPLEGEPRARVLVAGATGFAGALAARLVWRHPQLELVGGHAPRGDAGAGSTRSTRATGCRWSCWSSISQRSEESTRRSSPTRTGRRRRSSQSCAALGIQVVDLSADFRLRDLANYERWYGAHGAPELLDGAVYGLTELNRDAIREAELVANPGLLPDRLAARARAGGRSRPHRATS